MKNRCIITAIVAMALLASSGRADGISSFRRMKFGFFVHYAWGGSAYAVTRNSDGSVPAGLDDLADRFDAPGFANDLASMGVEYVVFTAWHANMNCLWPSAKMDQWVPGHTSQRDLLSDMITAVKAKGIRVLFYTHPRDGHDMSPADQVATGWNGTINDGSNNPNFNVFDRSKWNDFINEIYGDLIDRYGAKIDGLFIDEGTAAGDSWRVVDYPRLRKTIKNRQPDLLMLHNFYGTIYSCDIGATEVAYWLSWVPGSNPDNWPATGRPMSMVMGSDWAASVPQGTPAPRYNSTEMYRMTVLRAGVNSTDGGGINWAAGPYPGGGWEDGVLAQMQQIGGWISPIRASICDTFPSQSWITPPDATINSLVAGVVATRSAGDGTEFIHVLRPPTGNSLTVPPPADGRGYSAATLLPSGHPVGLVRGGDGSLTLTLQGTDTWNSRDTVIKLTPVTVAWIGNDAVNGPNTGRWNETTNNFTGGAPNPNRFRGGDNVNFSSNGASSAIYGSSGGPVGDLRFSSKDYHIYPSGSPVMTLSSGRIDVASGISATFHQSGASGALSISGSSGVAKSGDGTLVFDLQSAYSGNTVLAAGVLAFASGGLGTSGNIIFDGGTLRYLPGNTSDISARIRDSLTPVRIDTNGNDVTFATPLSTTNVGGVVKMGAGALYLRGGFHSYGGATVIGQGSLKIAAGTNAAAIIPNPGFELPAYSPHDWSYNPTGTGWTHIDSSGTTSNGTPWVGAAPEGMQCAFIQNNGSMSTNVTVNVTGDYVLAFKVSNRPSMQPTGLVVKIDGTTVINLAPGHIGAGNDFTRFQSAAVHLAAGAHPLAFQGVQDGADTDIAIDDVSLTGASSGALPATTRLELTGLTAAFEPGSGSSTLASLAGVAGSQVVLAGSNLAIAGNDSVAAFAGTITGTGSLTNEGTLRLVGDAALNFAGSFTNHGVLDIMTWNGTLPAGFDNQGIVLDRGLVRINSVVRSGTGCSLTIQGYKGHSYQLQRSDTLSADWQNVGDPVPGNNAPIVFNDPSGTPTDRRFYRVSINP